MVQYIRTRGGGDVVLRCAAWVSAKDGSGGHSLCLASHSQRADFYHAVKLYSLFHTRPFTLDVGGFPTRLVTNPSPKEVTAFAEKKVCACGACQNIKIFRDSFDHCESLRGTYFRLQQPLRITIRNLILHNGEKRASKHEEGEPSEAEESGFWAG